MVPVKVQRHPRRLIFRGLGVEVFVITWKPRTCSNKHDHDAGGIVILLDQPMFEIAGDGTVAQGKKGDVLRVSPAGIHTVGNIGDKTAHSLHIYFTSQMKMNRFPHNAKDIAALASIGGEFTK
jgi:predicted metal-dependent enzyme (double-stranded beta helix superfamily)